MRIKKEIESKIKELYKLAQEGKLNILRVIIITDALSWVLGDDYLDTNVLIGDENDNNNIS